MKKLAILVSFLVAVITAGIITIDLTQDEQYVWYYLLIPVQLFAAYAFYKISESTYRLSAPPTPPTQFEHEFYKQLQLGNPAKIKITYELPEAYNLPATQARLITATDAHLLNYVKSLLKLPYPTNPIRTAVEYGVAGIVKELNIPNFKVYVRDATEIAPPPRQSNLKGHIELEPDD